MRYDRRKKYEKEGNKDAQDNYRSINFILGAGDYFPHCRSTYTPSPCYCSSYHYYEINFRKKKEKLLNEKKLGLVFVANPFLNKKKQLTG